MVIDLGKESSILLKLLDENLMNRLTIHAKGKLINLQMRKLVNSPNDQNSFHQQ